MPGLTVLVGLKHALPLTVVRKVPRVARDTERPAGDDEVRAPGD